MADTKTSDLTAIAGADIATGDKFIVLDVSDTTQGSAGTLKNTTRAEMVIALQAAGLGTVSSVGMSVPAGLEVSGSPVTGSGTLAVMFAAGYSIPTDVKQGQWDTAYGWGNHASAGYLVANDTLNVATGDEVSLSLTYTTNKAAGNDTGLLINQIDTASPGTSYLLDMQRGGVSYYRFANDGKFYVGTDTDVWIEGVGNSLDISGGNNSSAAVRGGTKSFHVRNDMMIGWSQNQNTIAGTPDVRLWRDAANTLALRYDLNSQQFNVYKTYTNASNYERLEITGNTISVGTVGTGADDIDLVLSAAGTGEVKVGSNVVLDASDVGTTVQAYDPDTLKANIGDTLTAGFISDSYSHGTVSSGTVTPAPGTGQEAIQHLTNGGAFTLAPPANPCTVIIEVTNNASAGVITTSGFTMVTGDSLTTTDGHDFILYITKTANFSHLSVVALQ